MLQMEILQECRLGTLCRMLLINVEQIIKRSMVLQMDLSQELLRSVYVTMHTLIKENLVNTIHHGMQMMTGTGLLHGRTLQIKIH